MGNIAVIDTETNWADAVMSIGTVVADSENFTLTDQRYHVLTAECALGGMYEDVLFLPTPAKPFYAPGRRPWRTCGSGWKG